MVRKLTDEDSFLSYKTSKYRLHYYETASNVRLVMLSDPKIDNLRPVLHQIFVSLYVEYVVKK
jgi:trafficking protein particle complex subunit 1